MLIMSNAWNSISKGNKKHSNTHALMYVICFQFVCINLFIITSQCHISVICIITKLPCFQADIIFQIIALKAPLMYCCNVTVQLNPWVKTFTTIIAITRISCSPFTIKGKLFIHTIVNHFNQNI